MFHWDEELSQWQPLDRIGLTEIPPNPPLIKVESGGSLIESQITKPGIYALFADLEPPVIRDVSPMDAGEISLDRFLVEASVSDSGAGISQIELVIDGKPVDYDYDPVQGWLTYFPSGLEWGLRNMDIIATDRAGNIAEFSTSFVIKEAFQFITIRAYPNPADSNINIEFKLTRFADVKLRIYNIAGELVYNRDMKSAAEGRFVWKCQNNAGNKVASGIYIYSLEASLYETNVQKQGSIAVVR